MSDEEVEKKPVCRGDVLLTAPAFAYIVKGSLQSRHCDHCLAKRQVLQRCSGCKITRYCNRDCQRSAWEFHKNECPHLKRIRPKVLPDTVRLIARIIFTLQNDGDKISGIISDTQSRTFNDLMNHYNEIKEDKKRQEHFVSIVAVLQEYLGEEELPNSTELLEIYGRVCVNSFSITDVDNNAVGTGIYLAASIIDHSCQANAHASFKGSEITIRSLVDWPQLDWSKVRISYIDVLNPTEIRRQELSDGYYFHCDCSACENIERRAIMASINCGNNSCDGPVIVYDDEDEDLPIPACRECGFSDFKPDTRSKYYQALKLTQDTLKETKKIPSLETCKKLVESQGSLFHKLNIWRVKTLDILFQAAIGKASWDTARNYGLENMTGLRFYHGSRRPLYAMTLLNLAKIEMFLLRIPDALQHLEVAAPILQVSHGKDNPVMKNELLPMFEQAKREMQMLKDTGGVDKLKRKVHLPS